MRTRSRADALVRFDRDGKLGEHWPIPRVTPVTELIELDDGRLGIGDWSNRVAGFAPTTERFAPLTGHPVRWGRDHELVARNLAANGDLLISRSHDDATLHVWSLARRKPLTGAWAKATLSAAALLGAGKHLMVDSARTVEILAAAGS